MIDLLDENCIQIHVHCTGASKVLYLTTRCHQCLLGTGSDSIQMDQEQDFMHVLRGIFYIKIFLYEIILGNLTVYYGFQFIQSIETIFFFS